MKHITLAFPNNRTVVISPKSKKSHTSESWARLKAKIAQACVGVIDDTGNLTVEKTLALVEANTEWKCTVVESLSIDVMNLVE